MENTMNDMNTQMVSCFESFQELIAACRDNGYVPTLRCHADDSMAAKRAKMSLRRAIRDAGYNVFPAIGWVEQHEYR